MPLNTSNAAGDAGGADPVESFDPNARTASEIGVEDCMFLFLNGSRVKAPVSIRKSE